MEGELKAAKPEGGRSEPAGTRAHHDPGLEGCRESLSPKGNSLMGRKEKSESGSCCFLHREYKHNGEAERKTKYDRGR